MTKKVGMWIDHKKSVIVTILDKGEDIKEIRSEAEKDLEIFADDRRQSSFLEHLNIYYDAVIDCIRDADSILIFGAGEAKDELRKRLAKDRNLGYRILDVLTDDKMTNHQIAAKVRYYFAESHLAKA
jgi:hypothetical protein